jgi:hypothetical protein
VKSKGRIVQSKLGKWAVQKWAYSTSVDWNAYDKWQNIKAKWLTNKSYWSSSGSSWAEIRPRTRQGRSGGPKICTKSMWKFLAGYLRLSNSRRLRHLNCLDPQPQKPSYAPARIYILKNFPGLYSGPLFTAGGGNEEGDSWERRVRMEKNVYPNRTLE